MQDVPYSVSLPFIVCKTFFSSLTHCDISTFFTQSGQLILSILNQRHFQNSPGISDLLSWVFKFQDHANLHSKCSNLLFYSSNLSPICWWNGCLAECYFCYGNTGFNFSRISFINCYYVTQIIDTYHILRLFLIYDSVYWGWLSWHSH
jgi:hypothetical protein